MSAPIWQRSSARFSARPIGADKDIDRRPQTRDHRQETGEVLGLADLLKRLPRIADAMLAFETPTEPDLWSLSWVEPISKPRSVA